MLLEIKNASLSLGGNPILKNLDLKIDEPCYLAIIGPNGAGKSTLLKSIVGIHGLDTGEVIVPDNFSSFEFFSYVPQSLAVMKGYNGWDLLDCFLYPERLKDKKNTEINDLLTFFDVSSFMERDLTTLSGGELQRIYLACALASKPKVLLLDESLSSMDPHIQEEVIQKLEKVQKETKVTIIHVSHQVNNAIHVSDRILAMKNGEVFYNGETSSFKQSDLESLFDYKFNCISHPDTGRPMIVPGKGEK
ncbi:MAG: ABC transporter ATP-binding protein [Deltaproteobacteria bacterium]|nr:MAG: ABC transporter ATP-binding protein [Deltaproteobacteria bacterium]